MKEYNFTTPAGVKYTQLLSDEDAEARGLLEKAVTPDNKAVTPDNKRVAPSKTDNSAEVKQTATARKRK